MKSYTIRRAAGPVALTGDAKAGPWASAESLAVDQFPWCKGGVKEATAARVLYDARAIYVQFICQDGHISTEVRPLNGNVCCDSCVEFFATVDPAKGPDYFNFEVNCCGQIHLGFGPRRGADRKLVAAPLASRIRVASSVPGPTKDESPDDKGWWLAAELPFDMLSEFAGVKIAPAAGSVWRGNFYRCGGKTNQQFAAWNPPGTPRPDFHCPEFFGELTFA